MCGIVACISNNVQKFGSIRCNFSLGVQFIDFLLQVASGDAKCFASGFQNCADAHCRENSLILLDSLDGFLVYELQFYRQVVPVQSRNFDLTWRKIDNGLTEANVAIVVEIPVFRVP